VLTSQNITALQMSCSHLGCIDLLCQLADVLLSILQLAHGLYRQVFESV
jgi:hypothetical protein